MKLTHGVNALYEHFVLQAQLVSNTTTLSATKEEVKKLETQLKSLVGDSEEIVSSLNKKHNAVIKSLEEKVFCPVTLNCQIRMCTESWH